MYQASLSLPFALRTTIRLTGLSCRRASEAIRLGAPDWGALSLELPDLGAADLGAPVLAEPVLDEPSRDELSRE